MVTLQAYWFAVSVAVNADAAWVTAVVVSVPSERVTDTLLPVRCFSVTVPVMVRSASSSVALRKLSVLMTPTVTTGSVRSIPAIASDIA